MRNKKRAFLELILVPLFSVAAKYDYLLEMGEKTAKSSKCNECHKVVYGEWSKDFHAKAYVNDPFKKDSKNYTATECIACHAAQETADEAPSQRRRDQLPPPAISKII